MIENNKNNPFQHLNRMEQFAVLLTDVRYCFLGKEHRMSREKITLMLDQIVHDEHLFYMIYFIGAYKAVKKENTTEKQKKETIDGMEQLMGWEKQNIRDKVTAVYGFNFSMDDLTKEKESGNPHEEFTTLMNLFYEKREFYKNFINSSL
jgi:alpha-acetolactate decarboxylase